MSTLEVNKIIPQGSGTALQIGENGDTITLPTGTVITLPNGSTNKTIDSLFEISLIIICKSRGSLFIKIKFG